MGNLMSDGVPQSAARPRWIEFDPRVPKTDWNGSSIRKVVAGNYLESQSLCQLNWIERRAIPAIINCFQSDTACVLSDCIDRIVSATELPNGWIGPESLGLRHDRRPLLDFAEFIEG
jgi:hypothetical protein